MPRDLSPFELDRELAKTVPRARAAYRALHTGRHVKLSVPDVLNDPETLDGLASEQSDPIAPPLVRFLYWLELMQRALPREGERLRRYRAEHHALDKPLSGHFTWRELLGHALRDGARRPALLDVLLERGDDLRDAGTRLFELRAELPSFGGRSRAELELPHPEIAAHALGFLKASADALGSLELGSLADVLERGLAPEAADGWPRQVSVRSLHDLLGSSDWLSGLRLDIGGLPVALSAASFVRGLLRLGSAWSEALAPAGQPFCIAHDPFGLSRAEAGALFASLPLSPVFLKRQLGLSKEDSMSHARALSQSSLLFARQLALRVLQDAPALNGPSALGNAFSEHATLALGFEVPPGAAGLLFRPRLGDAQRLAGFFLAAAHTIELADDHDEDWHRNPRAIEQLRAEAHQPPSATCTTEALEAGARALTQTLTARL
ncbi:MAG TPA: hypothetical protein VNG33_22670 [Polyangiaceae bacterium]|nr:hypothetical protein [Polyangiaceae bacterium]